MSRAKATSQEKTSTAIDWRWVEQRLEFTRNAIEDIAQPSPTETQRILKARAEALARVPEQAVVTEACIEVVEFLLAYERYAVETRYVREVCPLERLTPLPCTPAFVIGVINLRGEILSVIDIKKFFDLPDKGLTDLNKVIVLDFAGMVFGVLVDAITSVRSIALVDIQPSLPTLTGLREAYLRGVTAERTVILDAEKLLTDEKIVVREEVAAKKSLAMGSVEQEGERP